MFKASFQVSAKEVKEYRDLHECGMLEARTILHRAARVRELELIKNQSESARDVSTLSNLLRRTIDVVRDVIDPES